MNTKTIRYIIYIFIIVICIVAIGIGVYAQFFMEEDISNNYDNDISAGGNQNLVTGQEIKQSFLDLFTDEFYIGNFDDSNVKKLDNRLT